MTKTVTIPVVDDPSELTEKQIADILTLKPLVEKWFKAVQKAAIDRINEGGAVPGWQLAAGRRSRNWIDEGSAVAAMASAGINDPYKHTLMSPSEAEKKISEEMKGILARGWEWHPGSPSLKQSAGAKAASVSMAVFDEVKSSEYGW